MKVKDFKHRCSVRALCYRSFDGQYHAPIYKLPVEILQLIASTLPPAGTAAFALSSRPILFVIGEGYLKLDKTNRLELLTLLERELPDYVLCQECIIFHRRTPLNQMDRTRDGHLHKYGQLYASSPLERGHGFLFNGGKQIINRRRYGPAYGPSAEDVNRFFALETTSHGTRASQHDELRVAKDRLLLKVHTAFHFRKNNARDREWARNFRVSFCPHISVHNAPKIYPDIEGERFLKCKRRFTEIQFRAEALEASRVKYSVTQWFDLG